jgi:hypothetical protein
MVDSYSIADNLVLNTYYLPPFAKAATINEAPSEHAESAGRKIRRAHPQRQTRTAAVSPAATSRRWWWRASSAARSSC